MKCMILSYDTDDDDDDDDPFQGALANSAASYNKYNSNCTLV